MRKKPLISVIIPAYNYAGMLSRSVGSVLSQLTPEVELIVINDGSTDSTQMVLDKILSDSDKNFRVIHQENKGLAFVRNKGVVEAVADYLIFLDADDQLENQAVVNILSHLKKNPESRMVVGGYTAIFSDKNKKKIFLPKQLPKQNISRLEDYLINKKISLVNGACVMHREIFEYGMYPEDVRSAEDIPVFAQALANVECTVLPSSIVRVYKHKQSMRHDVIESKKAGMRLVHEVFRSKRLPDSCLKLEKKYRSARALSLSRDFFRAGFNIEGRRYYCYAVKNRPASLLKLSYLRKLVKSAFVRKGCNEK